MRRAARVDANQDEIIAALRAAGAGVLSLAAMGGGVPDLLVEFRGTLYLLEVKMPREKLTPLQVAWHAAWPGYVKIVYGVNSALRAVGANVESLT
jgi:hypothetical protein